jgi:hypothetical protein
MLRALTEARPDLSFGSILLHVCRRGAAALSKLRAEDDPQDPLDFAEAKFNKEHSWTALRFLACL